MSWPRSARPSHDEGTRLSGWTPVTGRRTASTIAGVSTELTRRRAVDLLRVATALCPAS
ncbi:MAG: putative leader peptide [Actinomycetes bacterium]